MNKVRLWTMGKFDGEPSTWLLPPQNALNKLKETIQQAKADGGVMDIVWGPDLNCRVIDEGSDKLLIPIQQTDGTFLYRLEDI